MIPVDTKTYLGYVTTCIDSQRAVVEEVLSTLGSLSVTDPTLAPQVQVTSISDVISVKVTNLAPVVVTLNAPGKTGTCTLRRDAINVVLTKNEESTTFTLTTAGSVNTNGLEFSWTSDSLLVQGYGTRHKYSDSWEGESLHSLVLGCATGKTKAMLPLIRFANKGAKEFPEKARRGFVDAVTTLPATGKTLGLLLAQARAISTTDLSLVHPQQSQ